MCLRGAPADYSGLRNTFRGLPDLGLIKIVNRNTAFILLLRIGKEFHIHYSTRKKLSSANNLVYQGQVKFRDRDC